MTKFVIWLIFSIAPGHYAHERKGGCDSVPECSRICREEVKETGAIACYYLEADNVGQER